MRYGVACGKGKSVSWQQWKGIFWRNRAPKLNRKDSDGDDDDDDDDNDNNNNNNNNNNTNKRQDSHDL